MRYMRGAGEIFVISCAMMALISCGNNSNSTIKNENQAKIDCPLLYMLDEDSYLDLRKTGWDATKDASNQIRKGRRHLIHVSSDLEGHIVLHDYKYSKLLKDIERNGEKYKKYNVDIGGIGSPEGLRYLIGGNDMESCSNQMKNVKPYSQEYNDYILQNITEMSEKSG
ncbi:hypothetical protein [Sphingomonas sp.]|uniref:hypothetical protein n=1 Tax=Sphingomonas sp. TaxID=28214 RepID=UPI003D6CF147